MFESKTIIDDYSVLYTFHTMGDAWLFYKEWIEDKDSEMLGYRVDPGNQCIFITFFKPLRC